MVKCQCSRSTTLLLHPTRTLTPTQPKEPVPSSPLSQTPIKQLQTTQILAPLQPVTLPTISTLPEEDESKPEQQEPEPDQHEPEQEYQEPETDQQEPETEQQPELLSQGVHRNLYPADGTPDYGKASPYLESVIARLQRKEYCNTYYNYIFFHLKITTQKFDYQGIICIVCHNILKLKYKNI